MEEPSGDRWHYFDVQSEGVVVLIRFVRDENGVEVFNQRKRIPLPEEIMDDLERLLGDANAKITVGQELKASENYRTAGASAFVTLTCNQDVESVMKAREEAQKIALAFADHRLQHGLSIIDEMAGKEPNPPPPLVIVSKTTVSLDTPETEEAPKRKGPKVRSKGKNKPVFRA